MDLKHLNGLNTFRVLWAGQSLSRLGTALTRFAVIIWAYQVYDSVMALALLGAFSCLAFVIASPFAGVLVDRMNRRKVMLISDIGAGLMTATMLTLFMFGRLELWQVYVAEILSGFFEAFQEPAYSASITVLVPKDQLTRTNGLLGLSRSVISLLVPVVAGLLLSAFNLGAVMAIDLLTLCLAVVSLALIRIPNPPPSEEGARAAGSFFKQMRYGLSYIYKRPGFRGILGVFFLINLFASITYMTVLTPMILARTGGDEVALGIVRTVMGVGGVIGGFLVAFRISFRRKIRGFLLATSLSFLFCDFAMGLSQSPLAWSIAGFVSEITIPFIVAPYYAIWQERIPADVQGRVFSAREMVQVTSQPIGFLLAGLLADKVFDPGLMPGGALVSLLGGLVGTGPGAGMSAMFLGTALLGGLTGLVGLVSRPVRELDNPPATV